VLSLHFDYSYVMIDNLVNLTVPCLTAGLDGITPKFSIAMSSGIQSLYLFCILDFPPAHFVFTCLNMLVVAFANFSVCFL